jgi:hypothetical protein
MAVCSTRTRRVSTPSCRPTTAAVISRCFTRSTSRGQDLGGDVVDVTAYLDLINIENAHNPEFLQWDYRFREFAFVRGLPILPSLGVQAVLK